jgi:hypothetical protein
MHGFFHGAGRAFSTTLPRADGWLDPYSRAAHHRLELLAVYPPRFPDSLGRDRQHPAVVHGPFVNSVDDLVESQSSPTSPDSIWFRILIRQCLK